MISTRQISWSLKLTLPEQDDLRRASVIPMSWVVALSGGYTRKKPTTACAGITASWRAFRGAGRGADGPESDAEFNAWDAFVRYSEASNTCAAHGQLPRQFGA